MKARQFLIGAALVVATAAVTTTVVSQNKAEPPPMSPEEMAMMQKCIEAGTPGEAHKVLNNRVGKWNGVVKMWMTPEAPEGQSTCTTEAQWILGGRYLNETVEGDFGGQTFLGHAWMGYDNVAKKYTSVWIDNMSTAIMSSEGTHDPATRSFKYTTECSCPIAGKPVKGRIVEKWTDNNHYVMEMYMPWHETGKEYKNMEIHYTRAK